MIQMSAHYIHSVMKYLKIMPLPIKRERSVLVPILTYTYLLLLKEPDRQLTLNPFFHEQYVRSVSGLTILREKNCIIFVYLRVSDM